MPPARERRRARVWDGVGENVGVFGRDDFVLAAHANQRGGFDSPRSALQALVGDGPEEFADGGERLDAVDYLPAHFLVVLRSGKHLAGDCGVRIREQDLARLRDWGGVVIHSGVVVPPQSGGRG